MPHNASPSADIKRLNERAQQRAQQIRLGTLQVLSYEGGQVNTVGVSGHRGDLSFG